MSKFDPALHIRIASTERLLPSREFIGLAQAVLEKGADFRLKAKGQSMQPFIKNGDILTISSLQRSPKPGDVAAAEHPESGLLIVHRILKVTDEKALIKGDGNWEADGWIGFAKIFGLVVRVERGSTDVQRGAQWRRRFLVHISRSAAFNRIRFSIYKRLILFGDFY